MRRLLSLLLLILSVPVFGADLADRSRIPDRSMRDGRPVYVASLAPLRTTYLPQIIPLPGGGGGGGMSIGGTVTGGTATRVLFVGAGGVLGDDAGLTYDSAANLLTIAGLTTPRVPYAGTGGQLVDESNLSYNAVSNILTSDNFSVISNGYFGVSSLGYFSATAAKTPDAATITVTTTANSLHLHEDGDFNFDFNNGPCGTAACTDPAFIAHSAVQNTTSYNAIANWGTARKYNVTLTESVATKVMQIPVAAEVGTGGVFWYTIYATDGATPQVRQGRVIFSLTADATVETCVLGTPEETDNTPTGTLTVTVACDTATPANAADFTLNAVSSLVQTTLEAYVSVDLIGPGQPARP